MWSLLYGHQISCVRDRTLSLALTLTPSQDAFTATALTLSPSQHAGVMQNLLESVCSGGVAAALFLVSDSSDVGKGGVRSLCLFRDYQTPSTVETKSKIVHLIRKRTILFEISKIFC